MLNSTGDCRSTSLVPDYVSAGANRLPDHETVETLYRLGERDRTVNIFGGCVRRPEARREMPRVSAFKEEPNIAGRFEDLDVKKDVQRDL
jgi:hypothetical protein